ncbi:O-antigen ligase family protein [Haliea sp. E1-2-M8]|uniref:O-antigen ligase family protein n=1 Tax=Haliea sp. E1-2-M8 TaxID=3064706 RepID=UPI002719B197|nr:O-antigen ligase family protein [Haliea sp. E1-2-M8]MDO8862433.1 O-antigen ligase family protein [Haliea sp. E1-2-M8]
MPNLTRSTLLLWLLAATLLLAPLLRSGNTPLALLLLELLALALLVLALWDPRFWLQLPRLQQLFLGGIVTLPVLYLIPLPALLASMLPGRETYELATSLALKGESGGWGGISLVPGETGAGFLKLLLPVAVFLAAIQLRHKRQQQLVFLLLGMAALQAFLGLVQYGAGIGGPAMIATDHANAGNAAGTYTSRNNFAGFLYLLLMPCLALYMATLGRHRPRGPSPIRQRLLFWSSLKGHQAFLFGALALLLILGVVFSRSRAGIGLTMLGVGLVSVLLARRIGGGKTSVSLIGSLLSVAVGLAVAIGLAPVWQRFAVSDPVSDGRFTIFTGALDAIRNSFPLGLGPGVFQESFFPWQHLSQASYLINQAHNGFLEWVYDGGLPALLLIGLGLFLFLQRWPALWRAGHWGDFRYLQVGTGLGLGLMLLHELVDYNLFVPANMAAFALLAAVFLQEYEEPVVQRSRSTTRREAPDPRAVSLPPPNPAATNPFMNS